MKLNAALSSLLFLLAIHPAISQKITAIQPESGAMGTSVTIVGTGFPSNASEMEVTFGTMRAVITSAGADAVTVTVPAGAAYDVPMIRVKSSGVIAYAPRPFITTFNGSGEITETSFLPRIDLTVGAGTTPNNLVSGDVDGDGNVDLVTANTGTNNISIFRNVRSDIAPVTAASFAAPLTLTTGSIWAITLADLNGDGKPEIIGTIPMYGKLVILQNASTPGVISFQSPVELSTNGDSAYGLATGDLTGDGRPEIVFTSIYYDRVSVYQNGIWNEGMTIAPYLFSTRADFDARNEAVDVTLGDFDGDGFQDILVASKGPADDLISVLRNTGQSSITSTSFAPKVDFYAGTGPTSVLLSDVDLDGKQDVITSNTLSWTLCLNRNLSTPGTIDATSFGPRQEYTTGSQPIKVAIGDFDGDGFPDAATANNSATKSLALFENSNVPGSPLSNAFLPRIELMAGGTASGITVADFNGDGMPDVATSNISTGTVSIFTNANLRTIPAATITSFSPDNGNFLDEVVIAGENFNAYLTNNLVKFNGVNATVISATTTTLKVAVPLYSATGKISVRVNGFETATSTADFTVYQIPAITSFSPAKGPVGTSVIIDGKNFSSVPSENIVLFGAVRATVTSATTNKLTVVVPAGTTYKAISVSVHDMVAYSNKPFTVTFPGEPLNASMFAHKIVVNSRIGSPGVLFPKDIAVGDLDGDGKPEVLMGGTAGGVSVFLNASIDGAVQVYKVGVVQNTSFDDANNLELADLDLDGKLDLIVCNGLQIDFFRNMSDPGAISFALPVTLETEGEARIAIADIDMDGRPDLVYGTAYGHGDGANVARNTTIRGRALSFAPPVIFRTKANCFDIAVADFDRDGKPDIIYSNADPNGNTLNGVSILRNQSVPLTIDANSFAPPVAFSAASMPLAVTVADFDDDGRLDFASAGDGYYVSVFQNIGAQGVITPASFTPNASWQVPSDTYSILASDLDGDGKPEIALPVCGLGCRVIALRNISSPGSPFSSSFEVPLDLGNVAYEVIAAAADLNGDGRPELIGPQEAMDDVYDLVIYENKATVTAIDPNVVKSNLILPNPVSAWATISVDDAGNHSSKTVRIYNASGQIVMTRSFADGEETKLDLSALKNGMYILQVHASTGIYSTRFAVVH